MLKYHNQNSYVKFLRWTTPLLDLFSQPPALRIMKKQRFTTFIGHVFSIIIATVCSVYLILQLQDLVNEANPSVIFTEEQMGNSNPIYLSQNNFTFVVMLSEWNVTALQTYNKNFQFTLLNCQRRRNLDSNGSLINVTSNCTTYQLEPCQIGKHFQSDYQQQFFKSLNLKNMYCPNSDQWAQRPLQIQGAIYSKDYQYLQLLTTYCRNVTVNSTCNPLNVQQQALQTGIYSVYVSDTLNKLAKPGYPFEPIIQNLVNSFSSTTSKDFLTQYKLTRANTDTGIIQSQIKEDNSMQMSTATQTSDFYNGQYLINHLITLDSKIAIYDRQYIKLAQILGQLGGLWQVLYLVAKLMIGPFVQSIMNLEIATKIFTFSQNKNHQGNRTPRNNIVSTDRNSLKKSLKFPDQKESIQIQNKKQSEQIDQYLNQRKQSSRLDFKALFYMICGCKKKEKEMISYATEKVLDITYILKKLVEIDKLKLLILNEKQLKLFQYLPKPYIPLQDTEQPLTAQSFIFKYEKSDQTQFTEACQSYHQIKNQTDKTHIDQILLQQLDDDMLGIFDCLEERNNHDIEINVCSQQLQSQYREDDLIIEDQQNQIQIPKNSIKKH